MGIWRFSESEMSVMVPRTRQGEVVETETTNGCRRDSKHKKGRMPRTGKKGGRKIGTKDEP